MSDIAYLVAQFSEANDQNKIAIAIQICDFYIDSCDYENVRKYGLEALPLAEKESDQAAMFSLILHIGQSYALQGKFYDAKEQYLLACKIAEQLENSSLLFSVYNSLLYVAHNEYNFTEAIEYGLKAKKIADFHDHEDNWVKISVNLFNLYVDMGKFDQAIDISKQILKKGKATVGLHCNLGRLYFFLKNRKLAIYHTMKAISIFSEQNDDFGLAVSYHVLARIDLQHNHFDLALKNVDKVIEYASKLGISGLVFDAQTMRATIYGMQGDNQSALEVFESLLDKVDTIEEKHILEDYYLNFAILCREMGDFEKMKLYGDISEDLKAIRNG